jgi:alpha-galactosidase
LGFSQALPDLPQWVAERYATHIRDYQQVIREFVSLATMYRLTNQPRRDRTWDLFAGFQYVLPTAERMLLCLFRLPGAKAQKRFYFAEIDAHATYRCRWLGSSRVEIWQGADMVGGVMISDLPEPGSAFILCERMPSR